MGIPLHISSAFLLLIALQLLFYLWRREGYTMNWIPVQPNRFLFICAAIVFTTLLFIKFMGTQTAFTAFVMALGLVVSLFEPVFALSFFISSMILRPWELIPTQGLMHLMPKTLAVACTISWFVYHARQKNLTIYWNTPCTLFVLYIFWLFLSAMMSGTIDSSLALYTRNFYPIIVMALLTMNSITKKEDLLILESSLIVAITGMVATALYITYTDPAVVFTDTRLHSPIFWGNPNDLASLIVVALPLLVFSQVLRAKTAASWFFGVACAIILLTGLWSSQSRGALVGLVVASFLYLVIYSGRLDKKLALTAVALVVPVVLYFAFTRQADDLHGSDLSRWAYTVAGFRMFKAYPLFGVGIGNYPMNYELFTPYFYEWGQRTAHSTWILLLSESGAIGLLLFGSLFTTTFLRAWGIRATHPQFILSMASYGIAMTFLSHAYNFAPYLVFAIVLGATRVMSPSQESASKEPDPADDVEHPNYSTQQSTEEPHIHLA